MPVSLRLQSEDRAKQIRSEISDLNNRIRRAPLMEKAVEDVLALTAPITDDTPPLFRVTTHVKLQGGHSVPHLPSPLAYYRRIQVGVKGHVDTRVIDLANYGSKQYTEDAWIRVVASQLNVSKQAALDHLDSHAMICDTRMVPGEYRLVYWGTNGPTLNTWRGYTVQPRPFGRSTGAAYVPETAIWFYTALTRICGGNIKLFKRFIAWCCFLVQRPTEKCGLAIVLVSKVQGAGKNSIICPLDAIIGCHSRVEATVSRVVKDGNGFLAGLKLICIDEATEGRPDTAGESLARVQSLITESMAVTRNLYENSVEGASYTAFAFLSNDASAGLRFRTSLRRFQFFQVVEKRLWGNVGSVLKTPRNPEAFHGQLLHMLLTLKHDDQLHNTIETYSAKGALRKSLEEEHPIIRVLYPLCQGSEFALHRSFMGVRNYTDNRKYNARPGEENMSAAEKRAEAERRQLENDVFCDRAIADGYFLMPRTTAIRRLASQFDRTQLPNVSKMLGDFNMRISLTPADLAVSMCGISEFAVEELKRDIANIGSSTVIPTTHLGWREFLRWATGHDWATIAGAFDIDIAGEVNSVNVPSIQHEQFQELVDYAVEMDDSGWVDIASMIRHCQQNASSRVGVFGDGLLAAGAPMLLSASEVQLGVQDASTFRMRRELMEVIQRCAVDGKLGGKDATLSGMLIEQIIGKACMLRRECQGEVFACDLILDAMSHVCPLPAGPSANGLRDLIQAYNNQDKFTCLDIVSSPNFPELFLDDEEFADAFEWRLICEDCQRARRNARDREIYLDEFQRQLRESFAGFPLLLGAVDDVIQITECPPDNRAMSVMCFLDIMLPLHEPCTADDAWDFLFGDVEKLKSTQGPDKFMSRQMEGDRYALILKDGWIDELANFFHCQIRTNTNPRGFVEANGTALSRDSYWFEVFLLWETTVKQSQSQLM